jgi:RNA polymerase sigma factor (sigma-70 family)
VQPEQTGEIVPLPGVWESTTDIALEELERVYAFVYRRVGNRADAEDLTQEVAMKAVPRLRPGSAPASIRGYLFATARTELARFWAHRFGLPEEELREDLVDPELDDLRESGDAMAAVTSILDQLPANYARVLELRFLRGYSAREVARELGTTVGGVRIMQLRALRAAARVSARA